MLYFLNSYLYYYESYFTDCVEMAAGGKKRGYAFFILNVGDRENNDTYFTYRDGADNDLLYFQKTFLENGMGFEWINKGAELHRNVKVNKWNHLKGMTKTRKDERSQKGTKLNSKSCCLKCHIKSLDYSDCEYVLFAISSHGREIKELEIEFIDGMVSLSDFLDAFSDANCPTLKGIPRLLILEACRVASKTKGW